jgi:hypothetical protein
MRGRKAKKLPLDYIRNLWKLVEAGSPVGKALALAILDERLKGKISKKLKELRVLQDDEAKSYRRKL